MLEGLDRFCNREGLQSGRYREQEILGIGERPTTCTVYPVKFRLIRSPILYIAAMLPLSCIGRTEGPDRLRPVEVKVVVLTMFELGEDVGDVPGEFQYWVEREGLTEVYAMPQAYHDVRGDGNGVIATVTGVGTARAAASVMALGLDPRFDLTRAYWLVAGIAGIDPHDASLGSAAWAEWVVDGDLAHEIDAREMPEDWPTGYVPLRKATPYEQPREEDEVGQAYHLHPGLVDWAYQLTKDTPLVDTEGMKIRRGYYEGYPNGQREPFVLKGDNLAAMTYWHGKLLNRWANDWMDYHTGGEGSYVTTAMEDTGTLQALTFLAQAGRVDLERVLVLRTASNYDMQWPEGTAAVSLSGEELGKYSAYLPALEAAHRVGGAVVHALVEGWPEYRDRLPEN